VENSTLQPVVDPLNPPWINSLNNGHAVLVSTPNQLPILRRRQAFARHTDLKTWGGAECRSSKIPRYPPPGHARNSTKLFHARRRWSSGRTSEPDW